MVTETIFHEAEVAISERIVDEKPVKGLAAAIKRAKKASKAQDTKYRQISEELRQERERGDVVPTIAKISGQTTIFEF